MMQGYDLEKAVPFIVKAMVKAGCRDAQMEDFVRRAIEADMAYMQEIDVIDEEGLMGEGEYDEDDAFEILLDRLAAGQVDEQDDDVMNHLAQMLDAYMQAQQDFMEESDLVG